jgi:hypothetical protein
MVFKFHVHNVVMVSKKLFNYNENGLIWPKSMSSQTCQTGELNTKLINIQHL